MHPRSCSFWLVSFALLQAGQAAHAGEKPVKALEVSVARPVAREVTDYEQFTGRTEAAMRVDLRARVTGYLTAARFKEGSLVKQGDVLFEIDPRPYQAQLNQAVSQINLARATLQLARLTLARDQAVAKAAPGSVSQQQLEQDRAAVNEAEARVKAAEASAEVAKLNLDFCKVTAPISGRIGRAQIDPGNLVLQDQTPLAVLVSQEPMHIEFAIDERTLLGLRRAMRENRLEGGKLPVAVGLVGEEGFPHQGILDSMDNRVDPDSGTIRLRATLANKDRELLPGMSVRARLAVSAPYKALLVSDRAIAADDGRKYVYIVDPENKTQVRWVKTGPLQADGLRAITEGLKPDDRVITRPLPGLRPGMSVRPQDADMSAPKAPPPPAETSSARGPAGSGVRVETRYAGASAEAVSEAVRFPIEQQVNGIEKLRYLRSRCTGDGKYALDVAFGSGVDPWRSQVLVQNRVALALPQLPETVREAGVHVRRGTSGVLLIVTLASRDNQYDSVYLGNYASIQIRDELARLAGVAEVGLVGNREYGFRVRLDPDRVAARSLSLGDVVEALRKEKWERGEGDEKLAELIVNAGAGGVVRLRDVATIDTGAFGPHSDAFQDNKPAAALIVYLTGDVAVRKVRAAVQERLHDLRPRLPPGLALEIGFDFSGIAESPEKTAGADHVLLDLDFASAPDGGTAEVLQKSASLVRQLPAVKRVLALSENPFDAFGGHPCLLLLLDPAATGKSDRANTLRAIRGKLAEVKDVAVRLRDLSVPGCLPRGAYPIDLALHGPKAAAVREWASVFADRLRQSKKLTDVWVNRDSVPRPSPYVEVNREAAAKLGVAMDDVFRTMEVYSAAVPVSQFNRFGRSFSLNVQADVRPGDWADGLGKLKVRNSRGQIIPLSAFVTVREVEVPRALDYLDFYPMVQLTANIEPGASPAAGQKLCVELAEEVRRDLGLTPEYRLMWLQGPLRANAAGQ
jgi:multidrug efflux system membrane fusion protein